MESLGCRTCNYRVIHISITFGFLFALSTTFLIMAFRVEPIPTGPLSEKSWKRKTMEDFEISRRKYVYLYNWTNSYDFITKNEKLELREIGPFVFNEEVKLLNFTWGNDAVSYNKNTIWYFDQSKSLSLDLNITHLNPISAITIYKAKDISNPLTQREFDYIVEKKDNFIITKTVRELLFESLVDKSFKPLKITPVEKFRWLDGNNSVEGIFTLFSDGKIVINSSTVLFNANDKLHLSIINKSCRNILFNTSTSNIYLGYETDHNCWNKSSESLPISMTLPHYLDHPAIGIKGLSPSSKLHRPTIVFDYPSKIRLETNITYQLNMKILPITWSLTFLKNLTAVEIPMIWFKDVSRMPDTVWQDVELEKHIYENKQIYLAMASVPLMIISICTGIIVYRKFFLRNN